MLDKYNNFNILLLLHAVVAQSFFKIKKIFWGDIRDFFSLAVGCIVVVVLMYCALKEKSVIQRSNNGGPESVAPGSIICRDFLFLIVRL